MSSSATQAKKSDQVRRKIPIEHQVVRNTCNLYQEQSSEEKKDINNDLMGDDGREQPIVSALPYAIARTRNPRVDAACALLEIPKRIFWSSRGVEPSATWYSTCIAGGVHRYCP
jgi:hypothetical protein